MHIVELISEASIFSRPDRYKIGHKVRVASSKQGQIMADKVRELFPDFDTSEDLEWVEDKPKAPVINLGRTGQSASGGTTRYFKRPNGKIFAFAGSDDTIQKGLIHAPGQKGSTEGNVGDLSEPVLSAAVVAKLIKRGANSIEDISEDDVKKVLNAAVNSGRTDYSVRDKNSRVADIIHFTVAVREPTKVFMQSPGFWDKYSAILPSAVHYANSGQIDRYADHFYKNGKVDAIWVKSDGMSDQKGKKTDIEAYVNKDGKAVPLKNLKISLKAGSSQFGQVGAGIITKDMNSEKHALSVAKRFFGDLGVEIQPPAEGYATKVEYWKNFYEQADAQLKRLLAGNDARKEAGVIAKIANMVTHHATKGDQEVKLVQLGSKGASSVHSFKGLYHKLVAEHINLDVSLRIGISKNNGEPRPELTIKDATSGKALIKLGYHATGDNKKIWNSVTMEPLLAELTSATIKRPAPVAQPAQNPVQPPNTPNTPGIRNQNRVPGQDKEMMGQTLR